jgi:hypothetical protein
VNDELCQGGVEGTVLEWELFRGCSFHIDCWVSLLRRSYEGLRGVNGRNRSWSHAFDKLIDQGAGAASHVEHTESLDNRSEICESWSERRRISTHESVVGTGPDGEAHVQESRLVVVQGTGCPRPARSCTSRFRAVGNPGIRTLITSPSWVRIDRVGRIGPSRTPMFSIVSRDTSWSRTHHDECHEWTRRPLSLTSRRPNGHGRPRHPLVEAVTR